MAGKSDYLESAILNHVLRNTAYTSPTTVYVGLYTVAPSDTGGGTEVSGNGYARVAVTFSAPSGTSPTTCNNQDVLFAANTGSDWGTVVAFGIFDASSAGNLLYWNTLTASKAIAVGDQAHFAASSLTISED